MVNDDSVRASDPAFASGEGEGEGEADGFDERFLGLRCPLPAANDDGRSIRRLDYTHFSVLLDTERRLAALTAVNIDGRLLRDVPRGDDWHLDPRVPADEQVGSELYARNDLDRGHLVRRRDPVWGTDAVAARAEYDTFAYTNAAPQAAVFNQSKELWNGLEDQVLAYAEASSLRLDVFTGAVFASDDRLYRGVQLPKRFWKIAAWYDTGRDRLAAAGFLLDQSNELDRIDLRSAQPTDAPPPLPGFRTFQVPIADLARDTGLDLAQLAAADVFLAPLRDAGRRWTTLTHPGQIRL
ncbi:DNA/RNA non-specific endonuclease [Herbiconiux sp. A18JL235]|uniref:DNA/RNA non-specific endonuclease n=1 Tax=Herbiconiux sp. A18JL235 TaxID=3152363 RepID=A0AB39BG70_9MICO